MHKPSLSLFKTTLLIVALSSTALLTGCAGGGDYGGGDRIYGEDGFYFDRNTNQWKDPDGEVCHTCTPDNGFKDYSR